MHELSHRSGAPSDPQEAPVVSLQATGADPVEWLSGERRVEISDAIVGIYRRFTGRGPTKVRTRLVEDQLVVTLEDFLTPIERTLVESGADGPVLAMREALRNEIAPYLREVVTQLTGRRVLSDLGTTHLRPERATERFLLHSAGTQSPMLRSA